MLTKSALNFFETGVVILTLLSIVGLGVYFYDIIYPEFTEYNPFDDYYTNAGIIKISIASVISRVTFLVLFVVLLTQRYRDSLTLKLIYLLSALIIGFLQWYELYYGSTFYYGEVRDKQGLMFPSLGSFMVTLVIWKIKYANDDLRNSATKAILAALLNVGLYLLWRLVYEPWNLEQS
jgi:hypothetical protein